jgi:uncharacterized protein
MFTDETVRHAVARAKELEITEFVVASGRGPSAWALIEALGGDGTGVTIVTLAAGFKAAFTMEMPDTERKKLSETGAVVVTASHVLSGVERSFGRKHQGTYPALIMADTLRLFGQGMKVVVECAIMAADAGTLSGGKIISIGGSGGGADTAVVMTPGHAATLFEQVKIHEVICKPDLF